VIEEVLTHWGLLRQKQKMERDYTETEETVNDLNIRSDAIESKYVAATREKKYNGRYKTRRTEVFLCLDIS
jgi:hypothetical protein